MAEKIEEGIREICREEIKKIKKVIDDYVRDFILKEIELLFKTYFNKYENLIQENHKGIQEILKILKKK